MVDPRHKHSFDFTPADSIDFMPCPFAQCPLKAGKVEKDLEQPSTKQFKKFPTSTGARSSACAFCSGPDFLRGAASGPRGREKELGAAIGPLGSARFSTCACCSGPDRRSWTAPVTTSEALEASLGRSWTALALSKCIVATVDFPEH